MKMVATAVAGAGTAGAALYMTNTTSAFANDALHSPHYPWEHQKMTKGLDMASVRRGYEVYKGVCAQCHSLKLVAFRNFVDQIATEDEAKEWAAEIEVEDGPDDEGNMFERPGKLSDYIPSPYANDNAARAANAGALPPDLSLITKARHGGEDYIFALLTGYRDSPAGINLREGLYYNPYFPGGAIGMPQPLFDGMVDYEDETESSVSQMAKDVSTFLVWVAEPEYNERKKMGLNALFVLALAAIPTLYFKRMKWSVMKNRAIRFTKM